MRLNPARFNRLLRRPARPGGGGLGQGVEWRRSAPCPCRDRSSGSAKPRCKRCRGLGAIWGDPVPAWTGLSSLKVAREYAAFGRWESGDTVLTVPGDSPLSAMGEHDRILMLDSTEPFQLVMKREAGLRVRDGRLVSLDRCFCLGADDALVELDPPVWDDDGTLEWAPGDLAPDPGQQFTLTGRRHPEFFMLGELPQDRAHQGGSALPRRIAVRRFQLFGNIGGRPT